MYVVSSATKSSHRFLFSEFIKVLLYVGYLRYQPVQAYPSLNTKWDPSSVCAQITMVFAQSAHWTFEGAPHRVSYRCSRNSLPWPSFSSQGSYFSSCCCEKKNTSMRSNSEEKGTCLSYSSSLEGITVCVGGVSLKSGVKCQLWQDPEAAGHITATVRCREQCVHPCLALN